MRVFNFAAGPAMLPIEVLEQARSELTDWESCGASVMEVSHRGKAFIELADKTEALLRELLLIPSHYKVLFLHGGARGQFSAVPMNLAERSATADYLRTGVWSGQAIKDSEAFLSKVNVVADESTSGYTTVPHPGAIRFTASAAYAHYTPNETINGVEFAFIPSSAGLPLVADMSSTILSRPIDVSQFSLIYASAQKNIGPSGLTIVIVREDMLGRARPETPPIWNYQYMATERSMVNTPSTFSWYIAHLVFGWIKDRGGLTAMAEANRAKSELLYKSIDGSDFYNNRVGPACRSWMNVPFTLAEDELTGRFITEAAASGLTNLEGHRSVGGIRASLYNAMPLTGVQALVDFMRHFEKRHG